MIYTDCLPAFERIASYGIPIRPPKAVQGWARHRLFECMAEFSGKYPGTVEGAERPDFMRPDLWDFYVERGLVYCQLIPERMRRFWAKGGYSGEIPSFTGILHDMEILGRYEDTPGFAGDAEKMMKRRQRLQGIAGTWLGSYSGGRLYYGSLYPLGQSPGRCAPRPSEGFLPMMGREVTKALLNPAEGTEISILDYKAQGLCIMAALSRDPALLSLARSKDPYLALGVILGIVPRDGYSKMEIGELKERFRTERERCKKIMLAYQYGAGASALGARWPEPGRGQALKDGLDKLFSHYVRWKRGLKAEYTLPDGYRATGASPTVVHVQGTDAYILRRIVTGLDLPEGARIIATNHDCIWVEHGIGMDAGSIAHAMERIADESVGVSGLFRVDTETVRHA